MPESDPALGTGHSAGHKATEMTQSCLNELIDPLCVTPKRQAIFNILYQDLASVRQRHAFSTITAQRRE